MSRRMQSASALAAPKQHIQKQPSNHNQSTHRSQIPDEPLMCLVTQLPSLLYVQIRSLRPRRSERLGTTAHVAAQDACKLPAIQTNVERQISVPMSRERAGNGRGSAQLRRGHETGLGPVFPSTVRGKEVCVGRHPSLIIAVGLMEKV